MIFPLIACWCNKFCSLYGSNSQVLLAYEKQRADDLQRKYIEALESGEGKRQKLEETERRVHQLQESLNRYGNSHYL